MSPAQPENRFAHLPRVFGRALVVMLPAVLLVTFLTVHFSRHSAPNHSQAGSTDLTAATLIPTNTPSAVLSARPIFPYSVVPGGVRDAQELQKITAADPVVAKHYSDFRIAIARTVQLDRPISMYVSYRRNNRVYWTRNRMMIPAGETVISDGENLARVRCGNRLSPVAVKPVAISEPDKEALETPEFVPPLMAELLPGDGNELFPGVPGAAAPVPSSVGPAPGGSGTPSTPLLPPFLGPGVPPIRGTSPPSPPPPPPPPVNTPEPGPLSLLFAGAALFAVLAIVTLRRRG